jgi:hypothetical protein
VLARPVECKGGRGIDGRLDLGDAPSAASINWSGVISRFERGDRLGPGQTDELVGCVDHGTDPAGGSS